MDRDNHSPVSGLVGAARLVFATTVVVATVIQLPMLAVSHWSLFDLRIYRTATHLVLHGGGSDLYNTVFSGGWLYTYPPFSVFVFAPLDPLPQGLATGVMVFGSVAALARICLLVGRSLADGWAADHELTVSRPTSQVASYLIGSVGLLLCVMSDAVRGTFGFGQINLLLAWMVTEDYCGLGRSAAGWGGLRGVLTGLAAGTKLTPGLSFVPRVLAGQARPAVAGALAGFATIAVSAVFLPGQTVDYFTKVVWNTSRPGDLGSEWNQSITGMVHRLVGDDGATGLPILILTLVAVVCGLYAATVRLREGDPLGCVLICAVTTSLVSPITWYHHLVLLPLVTVWVTARLRTWGARTAILLQLQALALCVWVVAGLYQNVPAGDGKEFHHDFGQTIVSEGVPLLGLLLVITLALATLARHLGRGSHPTRADESAEGSSHGNQPVSTSVDV